MLQGPTGKKSVAFQQPIMSYKLACSFEDGLKLVDLRGKSMQQAADAKPSAMVSVIGLDADTASHPTHCAPQHSSSL